MVTKVPKSSLMEKVARGEQRETFEHEELGWFDVSAMREVAAKRGELVRIDISCVIDFVCANRVRDEQRVLDLPDGAWQHDPVLYVRIQEPVPLPTSYLLIDGTHRILRRAHEGMSYVDAFILNESDIIRPDWSKMGKTIDLLGIDWGETVEELRGRQ